jgi:fucose permease
MKKSNHPYASIPVFLAFLCMGFGDVVGPLTGLIKQEFQLSNVLAQMIPFMGFLMFGLLSIPIGVIQDKYGRRNNLLTGLFLALLGMTIPYLFNFSTFGAILLGIFLLGTGATFLQVSGNPLMRDVSPEGKYSRNLSLAQFVKAIGTLSGALIPLLAANFWGLDWRILFPVYSVALLITIIWIWLAPVREKNADKANRATLISSLRLLNNRFVFLMVSGIFLYVGAEVSMSSGLPIFLHDRFDLDIEKLGLLGTLFFFIALMSGRFLGALILNYIRARLFLKISLLISVLGFMGLFVHDQGISMTGIFLIGLGFANIFPLIFSITVDAMPERGNELSGLMVTAIVGGTIIPLIMGFVADMSNTGFGFIVPVVCIVYLIVLSFSVPQLKKEVRT